MVEVTNWHHVNFWNKSAAIVERFVFKGNEIAVEGKLSSRSWEDMNGTRHYMTQVIGTNLVLMSTKKEEKTEEN